MKPDDWSFRIKALEQMGMSLTEIGVEIGLTPSSMSDLKRGESKAPRGMAAVKLHALYERMTRAAAKKAA